MGVGVSRDHGGIPLEHQRRDGQRLRQRQNVPVGVVVTRPNQSILGRGALSRNRSFNGERVPSRVVARNLGDGLLVSATDGDGVVEAVEMPGQDFVVAVQWHPEETLGDLRIFTGLIDAARTFAQEKVS